MGKCYVTCTVHYVTTPLSCLLYVCSPKLATLIVCVICRKYSQMTALSIYQLHQPLPLLPWAHLLPPLLSAHLHHGYIHVCTCSSTHNSYCLYNCNCMGSTVGLLSAHDTMEYYISMAPLPSPSPLSSP